MAIFAAVAFFNSARQQRALPACLPSHRRSSQVKTAVLQFLQVRLMAARARFPSRGWTRMAITTRRPRPM